MPRKTSAGGNAPICTIPDYFSWQKSIARFCLSKLSLLSEMFMARAKLVWLIHQSRKLQESLFFHFYFLSLQIVRTPNLAHASQMKRWGCSGTRDLNFCLFLQEELALGGAVTVYLQVSTNHCLSRHWVPDLIWQKLRLNKLKILIPLPGCVLGIFITSKHFTSSRPPI